MISICLESAGELGVGGWLNWLALTPPLAAGRALQAEQAGASCSPGRFVLAFLRSPRSEARQRRRVRSVDVPAACPQHPGIKGEELENHPCRTRGDLHSLCSAGGKQDGG